MADPFKVRNAESEDPRDIGVEFVEDHTEYAKIAAHEHTIAWGSRGSGKTMHIRFLEPAAWIVRNSADDQERGFRKFLQSGAGFVGIYINCREPALSREEFRFVEKETPEAELLTITDRYLAQVILLKVAKTFLEQLPFLCGDGIDAHQLPIALRSMAASSPVTIRSFLANVEPAATHHLDKLRHLYDGLLNHRPISEEGRDWITSLPTVKPDATDLVRVLKASIGSNSPFFLMFDEANELSDLFQMGVGALLARRSQNDLCIKVASQLHGFSPERAAGRPAQPIHDFVPIDLDALYTNNQDAYYQRVRSIAAFRLRREGIAADVDDYLPANPTDVKLLARAREIAGDRFDQLPQDQRPLDRANFVKKYAPAIVFQELAHPKAGKSYAGFDNLVHLSSGIVRSFLDCCSRMYSRYMESHPGVEPTSIPISIQNDVIESYSSAFIDVIQERIDSFRGDATERTFHAHLNHLLKGLGSLFRQRLMNRDSREPRIISVSLKDDPSPRLAAVLRMAEQDAYLQKVWYRSKRGTGKLACYVLNRRLCPHFGLDITGFQGRLELSGAELELALDSPDDFARAVIARSHQPDDSQTHLWEW